MFFYINPGHSLNLDIKLYRSNINHEISCTYIYNIYIYILNDIMQHEYTIQRTVSCRSALFLFYFFPIIPPQSLRFHLFNVKGHASKFTVTWSNKALTKQSNESIQMLFRHDCTTQHEIKIHHFTIATCFHFQTHYVTKRFFQKECYHFTFSYPENHLLQTSETPTKSTLSTFCWVTMRWASLRLRVRHPANKSDYGHDLFWTTIGWVF